MKNLILFILLLNIFSCNKESDPVQSSTTSSVVPKKPLEGKWELMTIDGQTLVSEDPIMVDIIWDFYSDGTFKGDFILECFNGCDSAYFVYAYWNLNNASQLHFVAYQDSDGQFQNGETEGFDFIIDHVNSTDLYLYKSIDKIYHFIRI